MKSRSAPGSSTPTSKPTSTNSLPRLFFGSLPLWGRVGLGAAGLAGATSYVVVAFTASDPLLRIVLRCLPVVPVAIWTIWLDRSRPLQSQPAFVRSGGRILLFLLVMAFAVLLLGLALNWLYDPSRVA